MAKDWVDYPTTTTPITAAALEDLESRVGGGVFNVKDEPYNAEGDGSTDDLTAINAAIAACQAAGGGTVYFPRGTYYCSAPLTITPTAASSPGTADGKYYAMTFKGAGAWSEGSVSQQSTPQGGTILKLADGGVATGGKLTFIGAGTVAIEDISFMEYASGGALPFLYTTSTQLKVTNCSFWGHSSKNQTTCTQDAIVLGGLGGGSSPVTDGTYASPFQGYMTVITGCAFHKITRAVYVRSWANAVVFTNNWIAHSCGGAAGSAPVEVLGISTSYNSSFVFSGNGIEGIGYTYGFKGDYITQNALGPNGFYDEPAGYTAHYYFGAAANYNLIIDGASKTTKPLVSEHASSAGRNMSITARQSANAITIPQDSYIKFGSHADARMYAYSNRLITPGSLEATGHGWFGTIGVGNSTTGYTICDLTSGSVSRFAIYSEAGALLGYVPIVPAGKFA